MKEHRDIFIATYEANADAIYRHLAFRIFSPTRAEELMHDAFMKFWEYLEGGHEVRNPRALLYRIADHLLIDERRKKSPESLDHLMETEGFDPPSMGHLDMETRVRYREAIDGLRGLREEERTMFLMRYFDDLDPREIADVFETSPNTISVTLNRIMKKVRAIMDDNET